MSSDVMATEAVPLKQPVNVNVFTSFTQFLTSYIGLSVIAGLFTFRLINSIVDDLFFPFLDISFLPEHKFSRINKTYDKSKNDISSDFHIKDYVHQIRWGNFLRELLVWIVMMILIYFVYVMSNAKDIVKINCKNRKGKNCDITCSEKKKIIKEEKKEEKKIQDELMKNTPDKQSKSESSNNNALKAGGIVAGVIIGGSILGVLSYYTLQNRRKEEEK